MLGGFKCSRNSLLALNLFYITIGVVLIALGAHWMTSNRVSSLPIIGGVVACGVFLLLISFGGIYATIKHHQVLLFFYMVVLFVLFIIQFSVACACLAVTKESRQSIAHQGWSSVNFQVKDSVQNAFQCCGYMKQDLGKLNASDPMAHPSCDAVRSCMDPECELSPNKCCDGIQKCNCPTCGTQLEYKIGEAFRVTGGVSLFFSFTEIVGAMLAGHFRNLYNSQLH